MTSSTTLIINMKWVYLCFFVSVLLISTLAVSSASARKLVVPSETQQTTHNPDQFSFDLHEEPSGREEGPWMEFSEVPTKVPRSADYGNMDGILSVPAIPDSTLPKSVDNGNVDEFPSVSQHNNADAVPKNADYVNMDKFAGVFVNADPDVPRNADPVVPRNADYVDIDGIPNVSSSHYESDIDGDIDDINSSINIPLPLTGEPDPDDLFESKDLANAIKPVESSDSVNAMEAAAGVPIH